PGQFEPRAGGLHLRETRIEGTAAHPGGIPGRTVASVTVSTPSGATVLRESRIRPEGAEDYREVIDWTAYAHDELDRVVRETGPAGVQAEYRHSSCCGKVEWQRDAAGVETHYLRDGNDRVVAKIV
ncbi:MAG TPA: hypothetical protein PLA50_11310, partial [Bacteroidia bacterium]|nr:hypothetical protein [Bacteroidia bacterium]